MSTELPEAMPAMELVACAGITYRQLDYWTNRGYLRPDERPDGKYGTGYSRTFSEAELAVADRMKRLIDGGLTPAVAAKVARSGDDDTDAILKAIARADNSYSVNLDRDSE